MSLTRNALDSFYHYASATLSVEDAESLEELAAKWRTEFSSEYDENVKAIAAAVRDMESGDVGKTAKDSVQDLRAELRSL